MRKKDIVGKRYGRWVVVKDSSSVRNKNGYSSRMVECKCDCGTIKNVRANNLYSGKSTSCGCLTMENSIKASTTHQMTKTRLYREWAAMIARCKYHKNYSDISPCDAWKKFENFRDWAMNSGYSEDLSLDRINPFGNYEPDNCRWIPMREQAYNKRNSKKYEINGVLKTIPEWARIYNINASTVKNRIRRGKDIKSALTGKTIHAISVYCVETHISYGSITECAEDMGLKKSGISRCVNGKYESYRGYHFRREDADYESIREGRQ